MTGNKPTNSAKQFAKGAKLYAEPFLPAEGAAETPDLRAKLDRQRLLFEPSLNH
jgi:hypothetical protein